jgi:hypothetical protein
MKIESIAHRQGGTKLTIGNTEYHFAEREDGRHVCEVTDEAHADRLLSIKEGFRLIDDAQATLDLDQVDPVKPGEAAITVVAPKRPGPKPKAK